MKMFKNVREAIKHYLSQNKSLADGLSAHDATLPVSCLPAEYDDTPYQTMVNGKITRTVGEYKAAMSKMSKGEWTTY